MNSEAMNTDARPIAYRARASEARAPDPRDSGAAVCLLTRTRALDGMQKEALVQHGASGPVWRLLCDEGPWLNGTDLAPFPLGYFAAGLASSLVGDIRREAVAAGVDAEGLSARLDIRFTMEGSILRGTMAAGVDSMQLTVAGGAKLKAADLQALATSVLKQSSAANRALAAHLPSRFALKVNGQPVEWPGEPVRSLEDIEDPVPFFEELEEPEGAGESPGPIVRKDAGVPSGDERAPGAGGAVGLQSDQKRSVQLQADVRLRDDGLMETGAMCLQPAGSRFVLLSDEQGPVESRRAPCGLMYLSAGIAFCFMTQLGRYAEIRKLPLDGYRIVQRTLFGNGAWPVETAVFLDSRDTPENNLEMVRMGERTCYVHTTLREPIELRIETAPPS